MAGDIKAKYGSSAAFTFTAFNSLAGSSTFLAGASSGAIDNTSALALDFLVAGKITWSSTAPAAGTRRLDTHVWGSLDDTPTYPVDGSGNAINGDAAKTFATSGDKFNSSAPMPPLTLADTASKVYTLRATGIARLFGAAGVPKFFGLWCSHGVTTASSTPHSSGNTWSYTPVLAQYT